MEEASRGKTRSKKKKQQSAAAVFSIDDDDNSEQGTDDEDDHQTASSTSAGQSATFASSSGNNDIEDLQCWLNKPEMKFCYQCQAVAGDGTLIPGHLFVTHDRMFCLEVVKSRRKSKQTWVRIRQPQRLLSTIVRITSRRSFPELITFKFGDLDHMQDEDIKVVAADRYILPEAGTATKAIKLLIVESEEKKVAAQEGNSES